MEEVSPNLSDNRKSNLQRPSAESLITLSNQQNALHDALTRQDIDLGIMYIGALFVLSQAENPDRLALAAHGIRELMEKLPSNLGVHAQAQKENHTPKVNELQDSWEKTLKHSRCHNGDRWDGVIDAHLKKFLSKLQSFLDWHKKHYPRKRIEVRRTLQKLDGSGRQLPPRLEEFAIDSWQEIRKFFVHISHHNYPSEPEEFTGYLYAFEIFLLDRLKPRTFDDFAKIDQIIDQGEQTW